MLNSKELKSSYLEYEKIRQKIEALRRKIEKLQNQLQETEDICLQEEIDMYIIGLDATIEYNIRELRRIQKNVDETILSVANQKLREILELRYLYRMQWTDIAESLGYSLRWVYRLHREALGCIDE